MRQLQPSDFTQHIHPRALEAILRYRETGELVWTPEPGTPEPEAPACLVCHGAGEVAVRAPGKPPTYVTCADCTITADRIRARIVRLIAKVRGPRRTFADFVQFASTDDIRALGEEAREWAERGEGSVLFVGPEGALKTTLATAIYLHRVETGRVRSAEWVKMTDLIEAIRHSYDRELQVPTEAPLAERVRTCELAVLDDLGAVNVTDRNASWVQEQVYQLVDYRAEVPGLATVITSNLSTDQLKEQLGPAIVSRLVGMCGGRIVLMDPGRDVRYDGMA